MDHKLAIVTAVAISVILVLESNLGIIQAQSWSITNDGGKQGPKPQVPLGPAIQYGHIIVIMAVWSDANGCTGDATPSSFTQNVFGNNQSPNTFVEGSGTGNCAMVGVPTPSYSLDGTCSFPSTIVTLGFGTYQVTQATNSFNTAPNTPYSVSYSAGCSGIINPNETKTCVINNLFLR